MPVSFYSRFPETSAGETICSCFFPSAFSAFLLDAATARLRPTPVPPRGTMSLSSQGTPALVPRRYRPQSTFRSPFNNVASLSTRTMKIAKDRREIERNMQSPANALVRTTFRAFCLVIALSTAMAWASVGGSISGVVKDPSERVIPNADVSVTETSTGISHHTRTDSNGYYILPVLSVGHYNLAIQATGFRGYELKDITLDTNAALRLDAALEVGSVEQTVSVNDDTIHVETTSSQLGQVISGRQISAV